MDRAITILRKRRAELVERLTELQAGKYCAGGRVIPGLNDSYVAHLGDSIANIDAEIAQLEAESAPPRHRPG